MPGTVTVIPCLKYIHCLIQGEREGRERQTSRERGIKRRERERKTRKICREREREKKDSEKGRDM